MTEWDEVVGGVTNAHRKIDYYRYGNSSSNDAQVVLHAETSAFAPESGAYFNEAWPELMRDPSSGAWHYLKTGSGADGLIHSYEFFTSTDTSGSVVGLLSQERISKGIADALTPTLGVILQQLKYAANNSSTTAAPQGIRYEVANVRRFVDEPGSVPIDTKMDYVWQSFSATGNLGLTSRTTTLPPVSTTQHGAGASSVTQVIELFDNFGYVKQTTDERGVVSNSTYDPSLGVLMRRVDDAATSGFKLTYDFSYDDRARVIATTMPAHEVDLGGTATSVKTTNWTLYRDGNASTADDVVRSNGYLVGTAATVVDPVTVMLLGKDGRTLDTKITQRVDGVAGAGTITTSGIPDVSELTGSSTFYTNSSRWLRHTVLTYDNDSHVISTQVFKDGGSDTTVQAYDLLGHLIRKKTPGGTITRWLYDSRERPTQVWVGTDDGASDGADWSPSTPGNLVLVSETAYDDASVGTSDFLDQPEIKTLTLHQDASTTRTTTYHYDWRRRQDYVQKPADSSVTYKTVNTYDSLDRVTMTDLYNVSGSVALIGHTASDFDDRGRVYESRNYAVSGGTFSTALPSDMWYDAGGNLVKSIAAGAGARFRKTAYDSLARPTNMYIGFDGSETSFNPSDSSLALSGDTIIEQSENTYDDSGAVIMSVRRERLSSAATTVLGDLSSGSYSASTRVTSSHTWYDGIGRPTAMADNGTNVVTRTGAAPASSGSQLVTATAYDNAGEAYLTTDPKGLKTKLIFDSAGRLKYSVENFDNFDESSESGMGDATDHSKDRVTKYTYTSDGKLATQIALDMEGTSGGGTNQTTSYIYTTQPTSGWDIASSMLLQKVRYPDSTDNSDSSSGSDHVALKYNRLGEVKERTDQNGSVHGYTYDQIGRLLHDSVGSLGTGVDGTVRRISRSYEVRGMLDTISSYDNATIGSGSVVNQVKLAYNGFGQLNSDSQANAGSVTTGTPTVSYGYADGTGSGAGSLSGGANQIRRTQITYPNARNVDLLYVDSGGTSGVSDALSRVAAISNSGTRSSESDVLASYQYMGLSRITTKDYPTPKVKLDYGSSGTNFDAFGRITSQNWIDYNGGSLTTDVFKINHGYDYDSNRTYAENTVQKTTSHVYGYDNLNRLISDQQGVFNSGTQTILGSQNLASSTNWTLDALGNQVATAKDGVGTYTINTANAANEYTTHTERGNVPKAHRAYDFNGDADDTRDWHAQGSSSFSVSSGNLVVSSVSASIDGVTQTDACGIVLLDGNLGAVDSELALQFPAGTTTGRAGLVFGYKSASDYWIRVFDFDSGSTSGSQKVAIYHVTKPTGMTSTTKSLVSYFDWSVSAGVNLESGFGSQSGATGYLPFKDFPDGFPTGRFGFYTTVPGTTFDHLYFWEDDHPSNMLGRWSNSILEAVDPATSSVPIYPDNSAGKSILIKNLRLQKFQTTFAIRRTGSYAIAKVIFDAQGPDDYDYVIIYHLDGQPAFSGYSQRGGLYGTYHYVTATTTTANMPSLSSSDVLWTRTTSDGSTLSIRCLAQSTEPTDSQWAAVGDCFSSSNFDLTGGQIGFTEWNGIGTVDDFKVKSYNASTSAFDTLEHVESFTVDGSGYALDTFHYDGNGNLLYDGNQAYTYDAWNRLTTVAHAYPSGSGTFSSGQVFDRMAYDGRGRRITKAVSNTGEWDCTYKYYYDGDRNIETRNGTDLTIKQQVWGGLYVDELIQEAVGTSVSLGSGDAITRTNYWVCQDANFNVLGIVDESGVLAERYEYTPYGQRTVYFSPGTNDVGCYAVTGASRRPQAFPFPHGLCEFGHQGLMHDEEVGLVYNRARELRPDVGRFMQRDEWGYVDGKSLYQIEFSQPTNCVDYLGRAATATTNGTQPAIRELRICFAGDTGLTDREFNSAVNNSLLFLNHALSSCCSQYKLACNVRLKDFRKPSFAKFRPFGDPNSVGGRAGDQERQLQPILALTGDGGSCVPVAVSTWPEMGRYGGITVSHALKSGEYESSGIFLENESTLDHNAAVQRNLAHELGHYFHYEKCNSSPCVDDKFHNTDPDNLMNPYVQRDSQVPKVDGCWCQKLQDMSRR